ncbi:hypothetical protein [Streptococcus sp. DD11]|uniref:hypothetical protein n=1 Tax=Streptococcus sp. DD11 TaxID=1777879 RepID=UPI000A845039|nr:hypothetical protein [Streptococcus sp. DD11]
MDDDKVLYFIDDDKSARYTEYYRALRKAFLAKGYILDFFPIIDEKSEQDFFEKLISKKIYGIILDFDLKGSSIYGNATELWKKIKSFNPLFPMCIYTSHKNDVTLPSAAEKVFEKDSDRDNIVEYLDEQISIGLNVIQELERVNLGFKSNSEFSVESLEIERKIDEQFSVKGQSKEQSSENTTELNSLIKEAYKIIEKYK